MSETVELTLTEKLGFAITEFLDNDSALVRYKVREEALSHRLAYYLQDLFPNLMVDCEYNKYGEDSAPKQGYGKNIRPDIIVHRRGIQEDNKMAIELKKQREPSKWDRKKLQRLTSNRGKKFHYNYSLGVFIGFPDVNPPNANVVWFQRGKSKEIEELRQL